MFAPGRARPKRKWKRIHLLRHILSRLYYRRVGKDSVILALCTLPTFNVLLFQLQVSFKQAICQRSQCISPSMNSATYDEAYSPFQKGRLVPPCNSKNSFTGKLKLSKKNPIGACTTLATHKNREFRVIKIEDTWWKETPYRQRETEDKMIEG